MMAKLTFSEAKSLIDSCHYSRLERISAERHIVLPPKFLGNIKNGVTEQLNSELQLVAKWTDGVLIAYNNVKIIDRVGRIFEEASYIHFNIKADFIVFRPVLGCLLKAVVNKKSPNHIGCLVHRCFNASIHKPHSQNDDWNGSYLQLGEEFIIKLTRIYVHNGVLSLRGDLYEESASKQKKSKSKNINSKKVFNSDDEYSNSGGDNLGTNKLPNYDSGIDDVLPKLQKKKKKKSENKQVHEAIVENTDASEIIKLKKKHKGHENDKQGQDFTEECYSRGDNLSYNRNDETVKSAKKRKHVQSEESMETSYSKAKIKKIKMEPCDTSMQESCIPKKCKKKAEMNIKLACDTSTQDKSLTQYLDDMLLSPKNESEDEPDSPVFPRLGSPVKTTSDNETGSKSVKEKKDWSDKETDDFYQAVQTYAPGKWTDIADYLQTSRTPRQLKHKWHKIRKDKEKLKKLEDKFDV